MSHPVFDIYVREVSVDLNSLLDSGDLLALGAGEQSDRDDPFYHPEIHNEIRMAYSHVLRGEVVGGSISIEGLVDDPIMKQVLDQAVEYEKSERDEPVSEEDPDFVARQYAKANSHVERAKMDVAKVGYLDVLRKRRAAEPKGMDVLDNIDGSSFYKNVAEPEDEALHAFERGKILETMGFHEMAIRAYRDAGEKMHRSTRYLESKSEAISSNAKRFSKVTVATVVALVFDVLMLFFS